MSTGWVILSVLFLALVTIWWVWEMNDHERRPPPGAPGSHRASSPKQATRERLAENVDHGWAFVCRRGDLAA